jgi:hypothetical protein
MFGKNGRAGRHYQECASRQSLHVATETENETRDKIYDARGKCMVHVFQVDDYRNFLAIVLTSGDGTLKVLRTHYCDLDAVVHGNLAARGLIVVLDLAEALGGVPVFVGSGVIIMLDETEPITGVASHYADLRRYGPIHGRRPSGETAANQTARNSSNGSRLQRINTPERDKGETFPDTRLGEPRAVIVPGAAITSGTRERVTRPR